MMSRELILIPKEKFDKMLNKLEERTTQIRDAINHTSKKMDASENEYYSANNSQLESDTKTDHANKVTTDDKMIAADNLSAHKISQGDEEKLIKTEPRWGIKRPLDKFISARRKQKTKRAKWEHL